MAYGSHFLSHQIEQAESFHKLLWDQRQRSKVVKVIVARSYLSFCDSMDWSLPDSSVHGILQARKLDWVAIPFSMESSQPRDVTWISYSAVRLFIVWAISKASVTSLCLKVLVAQSCPTFCDSMNCSPPDSPVHGIFQSKILEWVAIPFSRGLPNPGIEPGLLHCRKILYRLSHQGRGKTRSKESYQFRLCSDLQASLPCLSPVRVARATQGSIQQNWSNHSQLSTPPHASEGISYFSRQGSLSDENCFQNTEFRSLWQWSCRNRAPGFTSDAQQAKLCKSRAQCWQNGDTTQFSTHSVMEKLFPQPPFLLSLWSQRTSGFYLYIRVWNKPWIQV